jgi:hypothetical protein
VEQREHQHAGHPPGHGTPAARARVSEPVAHFKIPRWGVATRSRRASLR